MNMSAIEPKETGRLGFHGSGRWFPLHPQKRARGAARDGSPHRSRITNPSRPTPPDEAGFVVFFPTPEYASTENGVWDPLVSMSLAARLTRSPRARCLTMKQTLQLAGWHRAMNVSGMAAADRASSIDLRVRRDGNRGASRSPNAWVGRHPYVQGVAACVASRPAGRRALPRACQEIVTGDLRPAPCRPRPRCLSSTSAPPGGAEPGIRISC